MGNDIREIKRKILQYLKETIETHAELVKYLKNLNSKGLQKVSKMYKKAVSQTEDIIETCQWSIIKLTPVSRDLRKLICYISIAQQIERIYKTASRIAKGAMNLNPSHVKIVINLENILSHILKSVVGLISEWNLKFGSKITEQHKVLHEEYLKSVQNLSDTFTESDQQNNRKDVVPFILALKYIERSGDHVIDIYEMVYYILKAEFVNSI